jgi:hypothetical protein
VTALGVSVVIAVTATSLADFSISNARSASTSEAGRLAYSAAESGLNDGLAVLYHSGSYHTKTFADQTTPFTVPSTPGYKVSFTWSAAVTDPVWRITAVGTVQSLTQGSRPITRTVKQAVEIRTAAGAGVDTTIWNYIYSDAPPGSPCFQLLNNASIADPLYVKGDLCVSPNAHIDSSPAFSAAHPTTPQLQVGGKITIGNNGYIGTSSNRLNGVQTGLGCGATPHNPCTSADSVWANQYLPQQPNLSKPVIDLATWYKDAAPGPLHPCTSGSFPGGFDNDGVQNASLGNVNLAPAAAYDCKFTDALGNLLGELRWTPGDPGSLLVSGTIFFDGNLYLDNNTRVVYQGRGALYFGGSITLDNNSYLCGIASCTAAWDSTANLVVLVAGSNAQSPSLAVNLSNNSIFQGAVEANGDIGESNNGGVWGSMIAHQVFVANNAVAHYVPFGTPVPGQPAQSGYTETLVLAPNGFSG